jgi:hypothetical protein
VGLNLPPAVIPVRVTTRLRHRVNHTNGRSQWPSGGTSKLMGAA